ncbi:MAG: LON peptidase substrate-binding domain-containing protein [Cyclobacteriaceae bacterium]
MIKDLALFPLNLVAFPGEELNLHIFEPRYKQLINDCLQTKSTFGIPSYVNTKVEYGTEVKISEVTKLYEDGRMDIKTIGMGMFKVVDFQNPWGERLYAGGQVEMIEVSDDEDPEIAEVILNKCEELFEWLHMDGEISLMNDTSVYKVIHKIGLKPEEEYDLLKITSEAKRQKFILNHLENLIPALERAEKAKERISMNGHFKHFDPLKF